MMGHMQHEDGETKSLTLRDYFVSVLAKYVITKDSKHVLSKFQITFCYNYKRPNVFFFTFV
jgi:hypothetical protein